MKRLIIFLFNILVGLYSCSEADLSGYASDSYIQFEKSDKDSTLFSFAYDEELQLGKVQLKVNCISTLCPEERKFCIHFLSDESSAKAGEDFIVPSEEQILPAYDSIACIEITLKRTVNLDKNDLVLVFEIAESADFKPGLTAYRKNRIIVSGHLTRPEWWNDWHESSGLGSYSEKKYSAFIHVTGMTDLTLAKDGGILDYSTMRTYVLQFKYWLLEHPTEDEDGGNMQVAMRG